MRKPIDLPPILRTPGLVLLEMGLDGQKTYFKFGVENDDIREITIIMTAPGNINWRFEYAIYDRETQTVVLYRGKHGDPTKDRRVKITGT